jgi:tetratricopeptide (TPR) repeat protein
MPSHHDEIDDHEIMQEDRLNGSIPFNEIYNGNSSEDESLYTGPVDRSAICLYSSNSLLRRFALRFLLDTQSSFSNLDELIKLLINKPSVTQNNIEILKQKYSADAAIYFYTRYEFIYKELNAALRSLKISDLIAFRYILKDMYAQLHEIMAHELNNQPTTVYRGQVAHVFEVLELFNVFEKRIPITITSFFSTTRDRNIAFAFLHGGIDQQQNIVRVPILFTINIRQEDISSYCPFADISGRSHFGEKEVLFSPGQSFIINKFEIIYGNLPFIYSIEMSLYNQIDDILDAKYMLLKSEYETETNGSLVSLAKMLNVYKRDDESKDIYVRLLGQEINQATMIACYSGLAQLAFFKGNKDEMMSYSNKLDELKFGVPYSSSCKNEIRLSDEDQRKCSMLYKKLEQLMTKMPMNVPWQQLINYYTSEETKEAINTIPKTAFDLAMLFMKSGDYGLAINYFQISLRGIGFAMHASSDYLLKSKCYIQIGHCYRLLKQYEKALENYSLASENNIPLPLDDYAEIVFGTGQLSNQFEAAQSKYKEVAEIYQKKAKKTYPNDVNLIE